MLLDELAEASLDGARKEHFTKLATVPLLTIDDLGMRKLPATAAEDLLELVMRRYERAATLITSNRPMEDWGSCSGTWPPLRDCSTAFYITPTCSRAARAARARGQPRAQLLQTVRHDMAQTHPVPYASRVTSPLTYSCPVCGLNCLQEPGDAEFASFELCPCCGTEFGYDDDQGACGEDLAPGMPGDHAYSNPEYRRAAHIALRGRWVASGMRWWSTASAPPAGWDPALQLSRLDEKGNR